MGLKLLVLLTCIGVFGMIFAFFYFTRPNTLHGFEWLVAIGTISAAVLTFAGIRGIIFEIKMRKILNSKS